MYNKYTQEDYKKIVELYRSEYEATHPPKPKMTAKIYGIRALLSPLIFIYGLFQLFTLTILPILLLLMFFRLILQPFIYLLKIGGTNIKVADSFFGFHDNITIDCLIHITISIWFSFYMVHLYVTTGEIFSL